LRVPHLIVSAAVLTISACASGGPDRSSEAASAVTTCSGPTEHAGPYTRRITVTRDSNAAGLIDPSLYYPLGADAGLMTYTTVPDMAHVHIAIAASSDRGATWKYLGDVTKATPTTVPEPGQMVDESSSLVVDAADPDPNRRLKVFAHHYFFGTSQAFQLGYLAMYTAPVPEGPWSETKLFGWDASGMAEGAVYDINTDPKLPELHDCFAVAEPGALARPDGTIDLAVSCPVVIPGPDTIDVRLLRSRDHGATWSFVSKLLTSQDGTSLGSSVPKINGADLFFANGAYHVVVSPEGPVDAPGGPGSGYRGCLVLPIADLERGAVARCNGAPVVEAAYRGRDRQFVGACSAAEGASIGMMIPVPDFAFSDPFRVFAADAPLP
jgi:hypothetical protein